MPDKRIKPIVIAHRGASGYLPEHTLAAYALAMRQGADFVEPDLVMTKDGQLIARHDNRLDLTTDVARRPAFADRKTTKTVDGISTSGWFSEDFTLDEIKQLRAIERLAEVRPANTKFDGQHDVPTLQEIIDAVKMHARTAGRDIGIYAETKHPTYFASLGLALEQPLIEILQRNGYSDGRAKAFIQSFEVGSLRKLRTLTGLPLVQLLEPNGKPYDVDIAGGALTYDQMSTAQGLKEIASYANAVGPEKHLIIPIQPNGSVSMADATGFVRDAHAAGLAVHAYTFRAENRFLPGNYRLGTDANALGNMKTEIQAFLAYGIDGFFTDQPDIGVQARDAFIQGLYGSSR